MICVIDYNVGNVESVCNAFRYIGTESELTAEPDKLRAASGLVLPGVAAFGFAINALGPLAELIRELALAGKPILGICVGYQMLFEKSCEFGEYQGLALVSGEVVPIPAGRVIPHMGWNEVELAKDMDLFAGLPEKKHFYFAHSFYGKAADADAKVAYTDYDMKLPAAVQKGNIFGTQFHPEKSGPQGLHVLRNFTALVEKGAR
jgi:glutamine amidotransferase